MKPVIGISGNILVNEDTLFPGLERAYTNHDYVKAVLAGGGTPVMLPVISDRESIEDQIRNVDGILMAGGYDVNPLIYGEEPIQEMGFCNPDVDGHDLMLIKTAYKMGKPILGICKGEQIINVAFGGTLYQDLSQIEGCYIRHSMNSKRDFAAHTVDIYKNTKLHEILGDIVVANSFHHQAVKDVAPGFVVSARAKDGVIEGIEMQGNEFVLGVQWHPESMFETHREMTELFRRFIEVCVAKKDNNI